MTLYKTSWRFLFMQQTKTFAPRKAYCVPTQELKDYSNHNIDLECQKAVGCCMFLL
jgi:DUF1365 family protein